MKNNIFSFICLAFGLVSLAGCQQYIGLQESELASTPKGEMPFCISAQDIDGEPLTKGVVSGEDYTTVATLQLICFDPSGYFLGLRTAYPTPDSGSQPKTGSFSGYVPEGTARIHFVANASLDLSDFAIGTSEKVIMSSQALSTKYDDIDQADPSAPKLCFWGYHMEASAAAMKGWLTAATPNSVSLLRDRARIKLTVASGLYSGAWLNDSAGSGKKVTSISWAVNNGRERGYLSTTPWVGYESSPAINEYKDCGRYSLSSETELDAFDPSGDNYQYVFDDSNIKTTSENGRITIVLKVSYANNGGGGEGTKYLLAQLREGSGAGTDEGEMVQVIRNKTYVLNITDLSHDGYGSFGDAVNPDADDFVNAPADVVITVPYITDGKHVLNLVSPKPVVVARIQNQTYTVEFEYTKEASEAATASGDFKIYWEENINSGWTSSSDGVVGTDLTLVSTSGNTSKWSFTVKIGTIGTSYAYSDYLVIRHKKSGLTRYIHFYAVEQFLYRVAPTLEQVMTDPSTPYLGPSGDDPARPLFKLSFKLSQSVQEDLFPLTVRMASSTLEPYGDKSTSATARLSGGFAVLNASTATSIDGTSLASSSTHDDWNYHSNIWNYWYGYTLQTYPVTGNVRDGEVVIYLKDIRDAYAQASSQDVGLYLDIENFGPVGLSIDADDVKFPAYPYTAGAVAGEYRVGNMANKYRAVVTGCPSGTYTLSEETPADWLTENTTSVTVGADGRLDFIFSVSDNTSGERSANIVFTSGPNTTKVTIIQASGMASGIRLKAENTEVRGNTKVVKLTVYSDAAWTLTADHGGTFSASSGSSTGDIGMPVNLIMPVNYTTSPINYTVTATKGGDAATVTITQRAATEHNSAITATFEAHQQFWKNNACTASDTRDYVTAIFDPVPGIAGTYSWTGLDPDPYRWDFTSSPTLGLTGEAVKKITQVDFKFHCLVETSKHYVPESITIPALDASLYNVTIDSALAADNSSWTLTMDPSVVLNGSELTISLNKYSTRNIALRYFTVHYTYYTWE